MNDHDDAAAQAEALHGQACELADADAQLALLERALQLDPGRASTHYDIGLIHKYRGAWPLSLRHNRRAAELRPGDEATNWNLAIAATALRDWPTARAAWARLGIPIAPGDGAIDEDFGITPVRLAPDADAEVVWGRRIDPVRVRIENIPFPESGYRCGDVVLHDGAPAGERSHRGQTYAVFDVLELFERSTEGTFEAEIRAADQHELDALVAALDRAEVHHENWTTNVRMLCRQCSLGLPHEHHDQAGERAWPDSHVIAVSATDPAPAAHAFARWADGGDRLLRFETKLAPSPQH